MFSEASKVLEKWLLCVNEGRLEEVLSLYAEDAILLPTFSDQVMKGLTPIRSYFEALGEKEGVVVKLRHDTLGVQTLGNVQDLGDGIFNLTGLYDWHFTDQGETWVVEARFTYTVNLAAERPISHHHSSQLPS